MTKEPIDFKAPEGKFKIFLRIEDLDTVTPTPDSNKEIGIKDSSEEAIEHAKTLYVPGSKHPTVYNDKGELIYPL